MGLQDLSLEQGGRTITKIRDSTTCSITLHQGAQTTAQIEGPDEASAAKAAWLLEGIAARHIFFESLDIAGSWPAPAGQNNENVSLGSLRKMTISIPIDDWFHVPMQQRAEPNALERNWSSWCPCCKRPLAIKLENVDMGELGETLPFHPNAHKKEQCYAYVATLWGDHPGYVLGALVFRACLGTRLTGEVQAHPALNQVCSEGSAL